MCRRASYSLLKLLLDLCFFCTITVIALPGITYAFNTHFGTTSKDALSTPQFLVENGSHSNYPSFARLNLSRDSNSSEPKSPRRARQRLRLWFERLFPRKEADPKKPVEELAEGTERTVKEEDTEGSASRRPNGARWAISAASTDLSGVWKPVVTAQWKQEYDSYLMNCSEPFVLRKVILNGMSFTREHIEQREQGRVLSFFTTSPAGSWNRTLVASGTDLSTDEVRPFNVTFEDPDQESVHVEAWWENDGTAHKSRLCGKQRVFGGVFETLRYLENQDTLICESKFLPGPNAPKSKNFQYGHVTWKYERVKSS